MFLLNKLYLAIHQTIQGFHLVISGCIHQGTAIGKNTVCCNIISGYRTDLACLWQYLQAGLRIDTGYHLGNSLRFRIHGSYQIIFIIICDRNKCVCILDIRLGHGIKIGKRIIAYHLKRFFKQKTAYEILA